MLSLLGKKGQAFLIGVFYWKRYPFRRKAVLAESPKVDVVLLALTMSCIYECGVNCFERQKQRKRSVNELNSPKTCVPLSGPFVFGINEERYAAGLQPRP